MKLGVRVEVGGGVVAVAGTTQAEALRWQSVQSFAVIQ